MTNLLKAVFAAYRTYRIHRQRQLALASLLELGATRLDDLGLSLQDVNDAVRARDEATKVLAQRREHRAASAPLGALRTV